jgi:SAM-dependent methyltransferase
MNNGRSAALRGDALMRVPAMRALLIQILALAATLALGFAVSSLTGAKLTITAIALSQGIIAAVITRLCKLAPWWWFLQAVFPIALVETLSLHIPPVFFLAAFLVLLCLFWSTFRTQVPFYPSGPVVWRAVAELLPQDRSIRFVDIGSGLGGLVLYLANRQREGSFLGIEIAPLPWFVSALRCRARRSNAEFLRGDYDQLDFVRYDVVFAYLSPAAMLALWQKASDEMRAGSLLLSYEFAIPDAVPDIVSVPIEGGPRLYGWYI